MLLEHSFTCQRFLIRHTIDGLLVVFMTSEILQREKINSGAFLSTRSSYAKITHTMERTLRNFLLNQFHAGIVKWPKCVLPFDSYHFNGNVIEIGGKPQVIFNLFHTQLEGWDRGISVADVKCHNKKLLEDRIRLNEI